MQVWSPGGNDSPEKEMATHCSALAWRIPWTEEPAGLQSMGVTKSWTWLKGLCTHARLDNTGSTSIVLHKDSRIPRAWASLHSLPSPSPDAKFLSFMKWLKNHLSCEIFPAWSRRETFHSWQRSWRRRLGIRKGGIEPRESLRIFSSIYPQKTRVCLLYCFVLSPMTLLGAVPHHHLALSVKELTYSSN